ncbi:MAG: hypothetical protein M0R50_06005 [Candidatus Cloacimonetes bacterium]|jgi:hypothetical protein|nr:hypothetical protein [Candidatus Cloacimonadota bacterium]
MQSFEQKEFLQWAKDKKLSFVSQTSWPNASNLIPPDEVATKIPANTTSHANLYMNSKKELFLAVNVVPDANTTDPLVLVFKQLTSLK